MIILKRDFYVYICIYYFGTVKFKKKKTSNILYALITYFWHFSLITDTVKTLPEEEKIEIREIRHY